MFIETVQANSITTQKEFFFKDYQNLDSIEIVLNSHLYSLVLANEITKSFNILVKI